MLCSGPSFVNPLISVLDAIPSPCPMPLWVAKTQFIPSVNLRGVSERACVYVCIFLSAKF